MSMTKLNVAVVGCGIGRAHLRAWRQLADHFVLRAICDIDQTKARLASEEHGVPRVVTDLAELCRQDDIDVIDLCTPPHLHAPQILQALAAGKHVVCEKPLVGGLKDLDEVAAAERASGRRVMPIFQYRWGHGLQKLKHLLGTGLAGTTHLATVETSWRRRADYYQVPWRGKWKTELGGCLVGHAIHNHDILCYVAGPVKRVFAHIATRVNPIETEDCAVVAMELADGAPASSAVTLGSSEEISRHRFCFAGFVAESNTRPYTHSGDPWKFVGDTPEHSAKIKEALAAFEPLPEGYEGQFLRFHRALQQGDEPPVTLQDARASIELISAMYHSAATNQPVALPLPNDHPAYASWLPLR
jgi:predicted dehydrogenase